MLINNSGYLHLGPSLLVCNNLPVTRGTLHTETLAKLDHNQEHRRCSHTKERSGYEAILIPKIREPWSDAEKC